MGVHSFLSKLKNERSSVAACVPAVKSTAPTKQELYRSRFQFGPNFGALFVQEKWIDNSLFTEKSKGDSELAALRGSKASGESMDQIREKWERRWYEFITDEDWKYLRECGVTCIRLPIGYWNLDGKFNKHTEFSEFSEVYRNSWKYVTDIIEAAHEEDIGVLVDMHGLPGGANGDEHSGSSSGEPALWTSSRNRDIALDVYEEVTRRITKFENVVGLELINEAPWGQQKLKSFYLEATGRIRKVDATLPLVISDAWNLDEWRQIVKDLDASVSSPKVPASVGFIIDTHVYRMFSENDKKKRAEEHVDGASNCVSSDDEVDVLTGEFSCVLSEESWRQCSGDRGKLEIEYGQRQLSTFERSTRAGAFFWTYKFGQGEGGAWDFRYVSRKSGLPNPQLQQRDDKDESLTKALNAHKAYWEERDSNQDWEHWRFEDGFRQGWDDSAVFAKFNGSRLGRVAAWSTARLAQHIKEKGSSDKTWVFKQAFIQGVNAFQGI